MAFQSGALVASNLAEAHGVISPARSGLMTVITADADVYGLRNVGERPFRVTMVRIRWVTTTAFAAAQCLSFRFTKVYAMQMVHDGGSPVTAVPHWRCPSVLPNAANVTTLAGSLVPATAALAETGLRQAALSVRISDTAAITMSNATLTYSAPSASEPDIYPVASGSTLPAIYEDWQPRDGLPLILEQNTGIVGKIGITMGATGVGRLYVGVDGYFL